MSNQKENKINIGWLAPNGKFYECGFMEHLDTADHLVKKYYGKKKFEEVCNRPEDYLMGKGFLKLTRDYAYGEFMGCYVCPSNYQVQFFESNYLTTGQQVAVKSLTDYAMRDSRCINGDCDLEEFEEPDNRTIHTMSEYPTPTEWVKITADVPVEKRFKPKIGETFPVIKSGSQYYKTKQLKFILVNGEEVGVFVMRECEVISEPTEKEYKNE